MFFYASATHADPFNHFRFDVEEHSKKTYIMYIRFAILHFNLSHILCFWIRRNTTCNLNMNHTCKCDSHTTLT